MKLVEIFVWKYVAIMDFYILSAASLGREAHDSRIGTYINIVCIRI